MDWHPHLIDLITWPQLCDWLAQVTPPAATPTPTPPIPAAAPTADEVALLKSQIALLEKAYGNLDKTFNRYITLVQTALTVAGIGVGVVIGVGTWLFRSSMLDFRQTLQGVNAEVERNLEQRVQAAVSESVLNQRAIIEAEVQQRVQREVSLVVRNRIDRLEDVLKREAILSDIKVDYVLPIAEPTAWPQNLGFLLKVLKSRGFNTLPKFLPDLQDENRATALPMLRGDLVVLDLENSQLPKDLAEKVIRRVAEKTPYQRSTLVVYTSGWYDEVNNLPAEGHYCLGAKSPLSLVGNTVDAAYIADAIKRG